LWVPSPLSGASPMDPQPNPQQSNHTCPPTANRVLIVDDELVNRELLSHALTRNGYRTTKVNNGIEALDRISAEPFDLVLLDVIMPGMDGMECLEKIREQFSATDLPVIMVTGEHDRERLLQAFRAGANDYITKPVDREILLIRASTHTNLRASLIALRYSEERYALAARGSNDGLWDWDIVRSEVYYSPRWKAMLGYADHEISHAPEEWLSRIHAEDLDKFQSTFLPEKESAYCGLNASCELRMIHRDGSYRWMMCRGVSVCNSVGNTERLAGSLTDVTEGKVGDALTGLPNRLLFFDRLSRVIDRYQRQRTSQFAVIFLDLDNFKLVNDSLGHDAGDKFLITLADHLKTCLRGCDSISRNMSSTLARHGGDEFTILLEDLHSPADVELITQRILGEIRKPLEINGQSITPSASIGWTIGHEGNLVAEDLLREADTAMYNAKSHGRNQARQYTAAMQAEAANRLEMENELRQALRKRQFLLHYQPLIENQRNRIMGFEALVRWQSPTRGLVPPLKFITLAEELGLIVPLGWQIFEMACEQAARWERDFPTQSVQVNVNFSLKQLYQPNFLSDFKTRVQEAGITPQKICVEVTESILMENPDLIIQILGEIRALGMRIAVDDFGTGYSSLAYLHRFPLDVVKIDRSFVTSMLTSHESLQIVKTIIDLARSLHLRVTAEGVEREEHYEKLRELGCDYSQGYLWSKPVEASAATQMIEATVGQISTTETSLPNLGSDLAPNLPNTPIVSL
jgi:diguanylate cyclase (GGDEF)-like protein/PAS domain S-box-containing protein